MTERQKCLCKGGAISILTLGVGCFVFSAPIVQSETENPYDSIHFNEVQIYGDSSKEDFVEIVNNGKTLELNDVRICKKTGSGNVSSIKTIPDETVIKSEQYFVWASSKDGFDENINADISSSGSIAKNNTVFLYREKCDNEIEKNLVIDSLEITEEKKGQAYAYNDEDKEWEWTPYVTPGKKNAFFEFDEKKSTVRLNELFPNPEGSDSDEWVELYNYGDETVLLTGWFLQDASEKEGDKEGSALAGSVEPGEFKIFENIPSLNNSEESIYLIRPDGKEQGAVTYQEADEGFSLSWNEAKRIWEWTPYATPRKENVFPEYETRYKSVRLNEVLPNPKGNDAMGEFIELYNFGPLELNLHGWKLKDGSASGEYTFPEGTRLPSKKYLVFYREAFDFALNNSDELVTLTNPDGKIIDRLSYASSKEGISLVWSGEYWGRSDHPTPGKKNRINSAPKISKYKIDKDIYVDVWANFEVQTRDKDNNPISVKWDFGDGRKSYKAKTRHRYPEKGFYSGAVTISDGVQEVEKQFSVQVIDYPKFDVKMRKISPNPPGKDSENEWIEIENMEQSKVNLKGWSIATGKSKEKLVNHPVSEDFWIGKEKSKKLDRNDAKISLNNTQGVIELRYPNGKVAQKVEYSSEKSVQEGLVFVDREGTSWAWMFLEHPLENVAATLPDPSEEKPKVFSSILNADFVGGQSRDTERLGAVLGEVTSYSFRKMSERVHSDENNRFHFSYCDALPEHYVVVFVKTLFQKVNSLLALK